mmetsp:Transcript_51262/g.163903  ORF Transcript_51262/g.163903 Transcript_51262/m.163903 type:complete len:338 (-) Transcript_51262:89-1102(-)
MDISSSKEVDVGAAAASSTAMGDEQQGAQLEDLPEALLARILGHLTPKEACRGVSGTSRGLRALVACGLPWVGMGAPYHALADVLRPGLIEFPRLYRALFESNLLRNPWFRKELNYDGPARLETFDSAAWLVTMTGGNGIKWEDIPEGMDTRPPTPIAPAGGPAEAPFGCLATSYSLIEIVQEVNLVKALGRAGLDEEVALAVLDKGLPLTFSIWVGARSDCGGEFSAEVILDNNGSVLSPYRPRHMPPGSAPWKQPMDGRDILYASPESSRHEVERDTWLSYQSDIEVSGPGARRAIIVLTGTDTSFWRGWYGAKFASAELRFSSGVETEPHIIPI